MKILASVYACSPYDGSERAVGWNWICELSKYHDLVALTSSVYQADIEKYRKQYPSQLKNVEFVYVKVAHTSWHKEYRGERLYYILWQKEVYRVAKALVKQQSFDLVHHITYVTCVLPTYLHKLNLPFVYGPVSGGENIPGIIRYPMNRKSLILEGIRLLSQRFFRATPNFRRTMEHSRVILSTTQETKELIPRKYHAKIKIFQSIGLKKSIFYPEPQKRSCSKCKILMAGRMLHWKGFELGILAFQYALRQGCDAQLTILADVSDGKEQLYSNIKKLCGSTLNHQIQFVSHVAHDKMKEFYDEFDVLLNCSLRDSGCFIVMEGMSRGLPVICVNTGGPKMNTTDEFAIKVEPAPFDQMKVSLANAIMKLSRERQLQLRMGEAARRYAFQNFLIEHRTIKMNEFYQKALDTQSKMERKHQKIPTESI